MILDVQKIHKHNLVLLSTTGEESQKQLSKALAVIVHTGGMTYVHNSNNVIKKLKAMSIFLVYAAGITMVVV